jgi:hypothetical protein
VKKGSVSQPRVDVVGGSLALSHIDELDVQQVWPDLWLLVVLLMSMMSGWRDHLCVGTPKYLAC